MSTNRARLLLAASLLAGPAAALADDTDIFLSSPSSTRSAPNVLIVLDNSANWSANFPGGTKFSAEMATLSTVIASLDEKVNVGLMMMDETGAGTSAPTSGSYVRFGVRNMNAVNRASLRSVVLGMGINADKTNNASWGFAMFEAYKYFGGGSGSPQGPTFFSNSAYSGFGQPKRDFPNNPQGGVAAGLPDNAFASSATRTYNSPIGDDCQRNYIIFLGNGFPQAGGDGGNPSAATLLANVGGNTTTIPLPSSTAKSNVADEYARFLFQTDVNGRAGQQNIVTYTVAVYDPAHMSGSDPDMLMLMTSMANQGGGRYFAATSAGALQRALETIFAEVQAVNGVFAASTLPVSVNVRGTYLNQVYMGVFRPDPDALPRWPGNLKEYRLAVSSADTLFLADVNGDAVENASTGFVSPTAVSYWTAPSVYWSFRPSGTGGTSDSPDGDIVEKGGAAQVLRSTYATSSALRKVYTCTGACGPGARLADTPFDDANAGITQAALGAASAADRTAIITGIRGQDLLDENLNANASEARPSIHGDVLHSRPGVVNYNRTGDDNDVVVFYGGNDGMLHAVKGGRAADGGTELWAFVAPEFFPKLKRLHDNSLKLSATDPRPYFFDGMIATWTVDADNDGVLSGGSDKVYLYVSARRGGRLLYALDVSNPDDPQLMWRHGCTSASGSASCDLGYGELGQTWSLPQPVKLHHTPNPVLWMGAGYDNIANDATPQSTATMGRGILAIDGLNGNVIWQAGPVPAGSSFSRTVSGMLFSIASDLTVLDRDGNGFVDRVYAPDTGGNLWRVDTDDANPANWTVTLLAALGGSGAQARKFLYPPDVVFGGEKQNYDAVLIGSGDREHPYDTTVINRFYMLKDTSMGMTGADLGIVESNLYDATGNLVQDGTATEQSAARTTLSGMKGWFVSLSAGEKVVSNAVTLAGTTYFGTNRPTPPAAGVCTANLGEARLYALGFQDAAATAENNGGVGLTLGDRHRVRAGGGYPPSLVPVSVKIDDRIHQGVVSGTQVLTAPIQAGKRKRTFWFLEFDK
jgi:type IV pilus assembly protein PilY1